MSNYFSKSGQLVNDYFFFFFRADKPSLITFTNSASGVVESFWILWSATSRRKSIDDDDCRFSTRCRRCSSQILKITRYRIIWTWNHSSDILSVHSKVSKLKQGAFSWRVEGNKFLLRVFLRRSFLRHAACHYFKGRRFALYQFLLFAAFFYWRTTALLLTAFIIVY